MSEPTIAARLIAPLLDACARLGGPELRDELARRFELDRARDPEMRLPLPYFYELLEHAAALAGGDLFGLHYSLGLDVATFGVLGFLATTSADLGIALDRMFRYQALLAEGERGTIERAGGRVTISMHNWGPPRLAHQLWNEAGSVDIVVNGRSMVGHEFEVLEVRFRHARSHAAERLRELLGAPLRFDAEDNAVVLPESVLALPMPSADPTMFELFDREAARRVADLEAPAPTVLDDVRRMIEATLPDGVPELAALAGRLGQSPRTLQRRLAEHGTSLRKLIDDVRHELALRHLAAELSIAEISWLLGFSQPSAFHRAFRRWTDRTPAQWRAG